ncbi:MAG TPA: ATP-dependent DNA helicase [Thermoplasmata archaeon]|nr:ATP-dependent DNA helicase [Thermoplasmata archaeon]
MRPGQERILAEIHSLGRTGGSLLVDAATGSGKTVATLAPLLEHAIQADHRVLYLVRTHAQEVQVLTEARAISHRLDAPIVALGLEGRQTRCLLLNGLAEMRGATAEEHGKLCADRKRATSRALTEGTRFSLPPDLPETGPVDLTDLDGCPYYARVLQADLEPILDRVASKLPLPQEFEEYSKGENLCSYELSKRLVPRARLVTAPYAFFFHPHIRASLLGWMEAGLERIDLVVDEAHNLPDHLRELSTVALPQESVRRARAELTERGDFALDGGLIASKLLDVVAKTVEELIEEHVRDEDGILPATALEDALLGSLGGTSHRLDTWLGSLAAWGETLREERRRQRRLPRSWVHTVALTLLAWPQLQPPMYVKVATREPRRALEAYCVEAAESAAAVRECHLSVHLSGTLAPLEEYRDALGLGDRARRIRVPSPFPPENRLFFYATDVSTRYEELAADPEALPRLADRLVEVIQALPVKTAVFFPSFQLLERVLASGLSSALPHGAVIESRRLPMGDLWRSIEGFKRSPGGGLLLGVSGGRIAEGIDFPEEELEAVVFVGIPYPKPTARREALRAYRDLTTGHGWEYTVDAPAQRALLQGFGRMIRTENDKGIGIILDRRAPQFARFLPGLHPLGDLAAIARQFYGRRSRGVDRSDEAATLDLPPAEGQN